MGVDPKRPLVGFALVAVLCAVLMTLSVGRGWGVDVFGPGRPIAAAAGPIERVPAPSAAPATPTVVSIPVELSPQPLGAAVGGPVPTQDPSPASEPASSEVRVEASAPETTRVRDATAADRRAERRADKAAEKVQRAADKAERKADRAADRAARKVDRAADKAERKVDRAADKAGRKADRAADKAGRKADRAAEKAARKG